jgi:hypothetical protein
MVRTQNLIVDTPVPEGFHIVVVSVTREPMEGFSPDRDSN